MKVVDLGKQRLGGALAHVPGGQEPGGVPGELLGVGMDLEPAHVGRACLTAVETASRRPLTSTQSLGRGERGL